MLTIGPAVGSRGREWPADLDVAALRCDGWTPTPFQQFIVKVHGRCDLACSYCYVYASPDRSFQQRTTPVCQVS